MQPNLHLDIDGTDIEIVKDLTSWAYYYLELVILK